ncbi:MAG TPA: ferritin-like domain-containing protein [Polyangiaceae bacterium]|jgi:hypothetical protein|nr:ferritin-like domain-containing protein [Polyangiaceae bacterium]
MPHSELFELSLLGGSVERRYRRLRPDAALPWGTLDTSAYDRATVEAAQQTWTLASFQEQHSAAACAETLRALIAARAPLDLVAMASSFVLDEILHVELCARVAMELGGAAPLWFDPHALAHRGGYDRSSLLEAAELVVRNYCVEESFSAPMLRGAWRSAEVPLIRDLLGRLAKDESAHARFGWIFLDWAADRLTDDDRRELAAAARDTIDRLRASWPAPCAEKNPLTGLDASSYLKLARRTIDDKIIAPLRQRGMDPT